MRKETWRAASPNFQPQRVRHSSEPVAVVFRSVCFILCVWEV